MESRNNAPNWDIRSARQQRNPTTRIRRTMTPEQRELHNARRRVNNQRRPADLINTSHANTPVVNGSELTDGNGDNSITVGTITRSNVPSSFHPGDNSRTVGTITRSNLPSSFQPGSSSANHNLDNNSSVGRQAYHLGPTTQSNVPPIFECGNTSRHQETPMDEDCVSSPITHLDTHNIDQQTTARTTVRSSTRPRRYHNLARNFRETNGYVRHRLRDPRKCRYCGATLFEGETSQLCCRNGRVSLQPIPAPVELKELFTANNAEGRHFRQYIRAYNHVFSFTSMGVHVDESLATGGQGIYTFRAHGVVYHRIGTLLPPPNSRPRYLQVWIVDTEHEIDNRLLENRELRRDLLTRIQSILDQYNPFVHVFRQLGQREDIPQCRLLIKQQAPNQHTYNLPTTSQVAAVIVDNEGVENMNNRDIIVEGMNGGLLNIQDVVGYYDPLQYPILLPYGTYGWDINSKNTDGTYLTCRDFYAYVLQIRDINPSLLLWGGRLLQQYAVDNYVKIETQRLRWYRQNQRTIRSDLYQGLQDCYNGGENNAGNVGHRTVLPSSFVGGPRDMYQRYQDAMSLVQTYGKPDLMLTMTCNPNWIEITNELLPFQTPQDRPDLLTRIFRAKFDEFKKDIVERGILGKVQAYSYVIEYQKRGLPHGHLLVIFENRDKLRTPDDFDQVVRAEIPSKEEEPALFEAVLRHMIHGPCGPHNPNSVCMKEGKCKKDFPKPFAPHTSRGNSSYPVYRRRQGAPVPLNGNETMMVDNGWVVPYNPWLLLKYDCHINVEVCGGIKGVKYIYKYIHKGPDRVAFELRTGENHDEIQQFVDGRWISAPEAFWRIFEFTMSRMYPSVIRLQIHLPNQHFVNFNAHQSISDILEDDHNSKTMLTEFFKMNCDPALTGKYLYREFPEHFTWNKSQKNWAARTSTNKVIGRIYIVSPSEGERFFLRILLNHVRGPRSFEELLTVNGVLYDTFKEAAEKRGLLQQNDYVRQCMREACSVRMPCSLRRLFVSILVFCQPTGVRQLWDEFYSYTVEDYVNSSTANAFAITNRLLLELRRLLHQYKKRITEFDLPTISDTFINDSPLPRIVEDELSVHIPEQDLLSIQMLNPHQKGAFQTILASIMHNQPSLFFIDGPGGTGKTFLYRALLAHLRKNGKIVIAVVTSGIAATLLPGGRTAHSRLKIPLKPTADSYCKIDKQTDLAELIRRAIAIVWDEAPMANRYAFEAVNNSLKDIMENNLPSGGKTMIFGGDFRQVLPVVKGGSIAQQIAASISRSTFWNDVKIIHLQQNMRSAEDEDFSHFLLQVGDGLQQSFNGDFIQLPQSMVIPWEGEQSIYQLIDSVFPDMIEHAHDANYMVAEPLLLQEMLMLIRSMKS